MSTTISLLLVEDEAILQLMLEEGLGEAGFDLVIKTDAASAIAELECNAATFSVIITDIRFGTSLSGWEVGRRAREIVPHMPIIYMSGDSASEWASRGVPDSVMIQKPFVVAQVVTAISMLLIKAQPAAVHE